MFQVLPNGLRVFVLQDKEVPLIQGSLLMAGGQVTLECLAMLAYSSSMTCSTDGGSFLEKEKDERQANMHRTG
jgi:hypothetical protein